jgi:cellulose synthase (UDP-forming)
VIFGFYMGFKQNSVIVLIFSPPILLLTLFYLFSKIINLFYSKFDLDGHNSLIYRYWQKNSRWDVKTAKQENKPSIDIFLPVAGEDYEYVFNTWVGVSELAKEYGKKLNVYVLDDKGDAVLEKKARVYGFNYFSRPNKGEHKKAGNLQYAIERTNGEYIIIFDADFRPTKDFIHELLPYMDDKRVSIVQSPQFFDTNDDIHKKSWLEYGAGNIQEYFYKIVQPSLNKVGGSICVGSNAIYRREALLDAGGMALINHSEDVWTGFKTVAKNWKIMYVPLILAKGVCPSDLYSFFNQQARWSGGSLSLVTSSEFWKAKIPTKTKLAYISGFLFYFSDIMTLILSLQIFVLIFGGVFQPSIEQAYIFGLFLINTFFLLYLHQYPKAKIGTILAYITASWAYAYAIVSYFLNISEKWHPTGVKRKLSGGFWSVVVFSLVYLTSYISLSVLTLLTDKIKLTDIRYFSVIFWIIVNCSVQLLFVGYLLVYIKKRLNGNKTTETKEKGDVKLLTYLGKS